jgi:hypothetical protein
MKTSTLHEWQQSAGRMEAVLGGAAALGGVTAVLAFLRYGWVLGLSVLLLSIVAYSLSRLFDVMSELLTRVDRIEEKMESQPQPPKLMP